MRKYRATVHVSGIAGENTRAARTALDEQLRASGLQNCRVVSIDPDLPADGSAPVSRSAGSETNWRQETNAGGLLLVAAAAWAVWFFWWMLTGEPPD